MVTFIIYLSFQSLGFILKSMWPLSSNHKAECTSPLLEAPLWLSFVLASSPAPFFAVSSSLTCTHSTHAPWKCKAGQVCAFVPSASHICSSGLAWKTPIHPPCVSPMPGPVGSFPVALNPTTQPSLLLSLSAPPLNSLLLPWLYHWPCGLICIRLFAVHEVLIRIRSLVQGAWSKYLLNK